MSLVSLSPGASSSAAGGFITSLDPHSASLLGPGLPATVTALFQSDYPGFAYVNSPTPADGTLAIESLSPFQNGLQGGLTITAGFTPGAPLPAGIYDWIQFVTITPLTSDFLGASSSPFTDPPPLARDDTLPFYWTAAQRLTAGVGYPAGGSAADPRFADTPRLNDSRAPVTMDLFLYLTVFDNSTNTVTIYDGVEYGFDIQSIPEPETFATVLGGLLLLALRYCRNR
jgi:hypothetical protein